MIDRSIAYNTREYKIVR